MASVYTLSIPMDLTQIISATKPTVRVDGSALVVGDRWVNTTDFVNCFWNGTFWLGTAIISSSNTITATSNAAPGAFTGIAAPVGSQIFLDFAFASYLNSSASPAINYYQLNLCTRQNWISATVTRGSIDGTSASYVGNATVAINTALTVGVNAGQVSEFCAQHTPVGTPTSTTQFVIGVQYRRIY